MGCNLRHEHDPYPYYDWYIKKYGKRRFDKLHEEWNVTTQMKNWQLEELHTNLKEAYDKAQKGE